MVKFKKLFSFSQKEIDFYFKNVKLKEKSLGLKLLQAPINQENKLPETFGKLLIVISKASGKAHDRNLMRRRLKSIFYNEKLFEKPIASILIVYKKAMQLDFDQLKDFLAKCI